MEEKLIKVNSELKRPLPPTLVDHIKELNLLYNLADAETKTQYLGSLRQAEK